MRIVEPKEMICKECGKIIKDKKDGFGIPVFKVFYFEREWTCISCFKGKVQKEVNKRLSILIKNPSRRA